jgi:uncharacterized protein YyaL (SSP411 family)
MKQIVWLVAALLGWLAPLHRAEAAAAGPSAAIEWQGWSDAVFERALRENRFVLLDLEAIWCHWCHVMDETTYQDPKVVELIRRRYIAVRVDQDARPDLSNRYEDYGWPATIVFDARGAEIIKRSGYLPPRQMASVLQAIIEDPTPGPSVVPESKIEYAREASLGQPLRQQLLEEHLAQYDFERGGWGLVHKFLDADSVEFSMRRSRTGELQAERMARQTLGAQLALLDPVWGGVYQYSTGGDWKQPHFEKIMSMQADNLRIYALAYALWRDPTYLHAAEQIQRYLQSFLSSPAGAFYTSQDSDLIPGQHSAEYFALGDAGRRRLGIPRVDTHVYARENGWAIQALVQLYSATGQIAYLDQARRAAQWILEHRGLKGGGFRHDRSDAAGPYLGDTLAMARAFLSLYGATAERSWLTRAEQAASFMAQNFIDPASTAGFTTAAIAAAAGAVAAAPKNGASPKPQRDENIALARFANLLHHTTGKAQHRELAVRALRYLVTPALAKRRPTAGVLLAELELSTSPAHITVVGRKDDPQARALFEAALAYPSTYKRVDWWDRREGPVPNTAVQYPQLAKAAAFACSNQRCSLPAFEPDQIRVRVDQLQRSAASGP